MVFRNAEMSRQRQHDEMTSSKVIESNKIICFAQASGWRVSQRVTRLRLDYFGGPIVVAGVVA